MIAKISLVLCSLFFCATYSYGSELREYEIKIIGSTDKDRVLLAVEELDRGESFEVVAARHSIRAQESLKPLWVKISPELPADILAAVRPLIAGGYNRNPVKQDNIWLIFFVQDVRGALKRRIEFQKDVEDSLELLIGEPLRNLTADDIAYLRRLMMELAVHPHAHIQAFCSQSIDDRDVELKDSRAVRVALGKAEDAKRCMADYESELFALPKSHLGVHQRNVWSAERIADFDSSWANIISSRQTQTYKFLKVINNNIEYLKSTLLALKQD